MSNPSQIAEPVLKAGSHSFQKGFGQVQRKDEQAVIEELMDAIGITTRPNFYRRLKGEVVPNVEEVQAITAVFNKYGIKEIWGAE